MSRDATIAGIDIGSQKIRIIVGLANEENNNAHIIGLGVVESTGVRKGSIVDVEECINNISSALEQAEKMSGTPIYSALISIGGSQLKGINSKGVVAINGQEITDHDIERVLEAAQAVSMPQNRKILRVIPKEYIVDETGGIKNPLGMIGTRLEVEAHIITGPTQAINNLEKCIHQAGVDIIDIVPTPLAISESVLSRRQKELGVVVIDIGSSSTSLAVFEEGTTLHTAVLPIGGEAVSNDIAIGLRTSVDTAEKIKIEYGHCFPEEISDREMIDLSTISKIDSHKVSKRQMAEIIQARYQEMFHMVKNELKFIERDGMLPAGVILTGASIKLPGVVDMARDTLGLPIQIGFPQKVSSVIEKIDDPSYSTLVGLILWAINHEPQNNSLGGNFEFKKIFGNMGSWFKNLLP